MSVGPAVDIVEDQHNAPVPCAFVRAQIFHERLARSSVLVDGRHDCGTKTLNIYDDALVEQVFPGITVDSWYWWSVVKNPPPATLVEV